MSQDVNESLFIINVNAVRKSVEMVDGERRSSSSPSIMKLIHFNTQSTTETHFYWIKVD